MFDINTNGFKKYLDAIGGTYVEKPEKEKIIFLMQDDDGKEDMIDLLIEYDVEYFKVVVHDGNVNAVEVSTA